MSGLPPIKSGVYARPMQMPVDLSGRESSLPSATGALQAAAPSPTGIVNPGTGVGSNENAFELLLSHTNQDQKASEQAVENLVTGKTEDVQDVVMQVVKAELSFQVFMEVRNQLIESYNELSRMQF